jgi:hypothetical protein
MFMTDDQKRRQRVELTIDLEKAQENASALRHALKTESDNLSVVAEWLHNSARSINLHTMGSEFYSNKVSDHVDVLEDERFRKSMNFDSVVELRDQLVSAQRRVEELAARLREIKAA